MRSTDDSVLAAALWDLVWAGLVSNDSLAPVRALLTAAGRPDRSAADPAAGRRVLPAGPARAAGPRRAAHAAGRWSLAPVRTPTRRGGPTPPAEGLLDRHGIVTRGAVVGRTVPGGFAAVYRVLAAFEESGRTRRGYFVEGLGAAQFASAGCGRPAPRHRRYGRSP